MTASGAAIGIRRVVLSIALALAYRQVPLSSTEARGIDDDPRRSQIQGDGPCRALP
jgi:hypothetical protein